MRRTKRSLKREMWRPILLRLTQGTKSVKKVSRILKKKDKEVTKAKIDAEAIVLNKIQLKLQEELRRARKIAKDQRWYDPSESKNNRVLCKSTLSEICLARGEVWSMESDGQIGNPTESCLMRKNNQENFGSNLSISLGMVYLDALVKDTRGSDEGKGETSTGKKQIKHGSGLGIGLGVGYLDNLVKDIRVSDQVQRREATVQGKNDYTDSHSRVSGQPNTKGL